MSRENKKHLGWSALLVLAACLLFGLNLWAGQDPPTPGVEVPTMAQYVNETSARAAADRAHVNRTAFNGQNGRQVATDAAQDAAHDGLDARHRNYSTNCAAMHDATASFGQLSFFFNYSTGDDGALGTRAAPYKTWGKVASMIAAIPFKNISVVGMARNPEAVSLSARMTPNSGIYLSSTLTTLDSGTVSSAKNPSGSPAYTNSSSCIRVRGKTLLPDYSNKLLRITGGTGSGQKRWIQSNYSGANGWQFNIETRWATVPNSSSTYEVCDVDWIQDAQSVVISNVPNLNIDGMIIRNYTAGNSLDLTSVSGTLNNVQASGGTGKRGLSMTSCAAITINQGLFYSCGLGAVGVGGTSTYNYCTARNNSAFGFQAGTDHSASFVSCDSRTNPSGYYFSNKGDCIAFNNSRSFGSANYGIKADTNAVMKGVASNMIDGNNAASSGAVGLYVTSGAQAAFGAAKNCYRNWSTADQSSYGVYLDQGGHAILGTGNVPVYSGNNTGRNNGYDPTSWAYTDLP